jgi:hypothetical protein
MIKLRVLKIGTKYYAGIFMFNALSWTSLPHENRADATRDGWKNMLLATHVHAEAIESIKDREYK